MHDFPNVPTMQVIMDIYPHSKIVGNLMHSIVNFQPNYAYVVTNLAQYLSNPRDIHIQVLKHTRQYIKGTFYGIKYHKYDFGQILHGFSNAIWARNKNT
jgi:hypothetical protein